MTVSGDIAGMNGLPLFFPFDQLIMVVVPKDRTEMVSTSFLLYALAATQILLGLVNDQLYNPDPPSRVWKVLAATMSLVWLVWGLRLSKKPPSEGWNVAASEPQIASLGQRFIIMQMVGILGGGLSVAFRHALSHPEMITIGSWRQSIVDQNVIVTGYVPSIGYVPTIYLGRWADCVALISNLASLYCIFLACKFALLFARSVFLQRPTHVARRGMTSHAKVWAGLMILAQIASLVRPGG